MKIKYCNDIQYILLWNRSREVYIIHAHANDSQASRFFDDTTFTNRPGNGQNAVQERKKTGGGANINPPPEYASFRGGGLSKGSP